jgi:hypothetical protein
VFFPKDLLDVDANEFFFIESVANVLMSAFKILEFVKVSNC